MQGKLSTVEKVIFLQEVDIFEFTSTENLSQIAMTVEELDFPKNREIFKEGDISDSMYLVISGAVRLSRGGSEIMVADQKKTFGTWALFDDEARMVSAVCLSDTKVLRISRDDFLDLLADNVGITQGILKQMARRLRSLIGRVPEIDSLNQT